MKHMTCYAVLECSVHPPAVSVLDRFNTLSLGLHHIQKESLWKCVENIS